MRNLMSRCWEALPENSRTGHVLDLLNAPIVGLDGFDTFAGDTLTLIPERCSLSAGLRYHPGHPKTTNAGSRPPR